MLVLSRKVGQSIVIGGGIRLTITAIHGNQTRVGIEAPKEITILRDELSRSIGTNPGPPAHGLRSRGGRSGPTRGRTRPAQ